MGHMQFPPLHVMDCAFILAMMKRKCAKKCSDMVCSTATGYSLTLDLKTFLKSMGKKKKYPKIVLTEEEVASIPLIEWEFESKQHHLLIHSWSSNNHATIYQLLTLCKDKGHKLWINNMRRSLHTFKPPDYDLAIWNKFHEFFKAASTPNQYVNASVIILPIIASIYAQNESGDSLEKTYQLFTSNVAQIMKSNPKYTGPSLRSICALFSICCKEIETNDPTKVQKAIDIAMELYKLSIEWKLDLSITTSTDYFNYLFRIFAAAKTSIPDFNVLFDILTHNVNNKILTESTCDALKTYLDTIQNMEIYENLVSDLNGFLFHDEERTQQLMEAPKLPRFRLSVLENSEIWNQLRLTQMNDESVVRYERKQLLLNKTRMEKLGMNQSAEQFGFFDETDEANARRKHKYDQFAKFMLKDGGAEVIIDGADVGHMIKQDRFSFDFVDHIASYYANTKGKKVRIILTQYRVYNAESCNNERVAKIIEKWNEKQWLIRVPNQLYDDVLWSIYALNSCVTYDGKVIIVTNDEMRDHQIALNDKRLFQEFLETKLCRIEIFKNQNKMAYDPFHASDHNPLKRKHELDEDQEEGPPLKKQKLDAQSSIMIQRNNTGNTHQNFHSKYEYIHTVYPYAMHEPYSFVIKPQFYQYPLNNINGNNNNNNAPQKWEELVWFLPHISSNSDCTNPQNMLKQSYPDWIIQKRIRWIVAKVRRPISIL
eukprot:595158_1